MQRLRFSIRYCLQISTGQDTKVPTTHRFAFHPAKVPISLQISREFRAGEGRLMQRTCREYKEQPWRQSEGRALRWLSGERLRLCGYVMAFLSVLVLLANIVYITVGSPTGSWNPDWKHGGDHGGHYGGYSGKPSQHGDGLTVDLGYAQYKGAATANGVKQFLGMRYAAPPLGDLRWRAPQDPERKNGVQDASTVCFV